MFHILLTSYHQAVQNNEISVHNMHYLKIKSRVLPYLRSLFIIHY